MRPTVPGNDLVAKVEDAMSDAYETLITADFSRLDTVVLPKLGQAMNALQSLCDGALEAPCSFKKELAPRLWLLRKQVVLVEAMLRQCLAFEQAAVQENAPDLVSYSPRGIELAI